MTAARLALVGNPNSGKTALFNALTGSRQKVANYAGVTVERKEGQLTGPSGEALSVLDLPGNRIVQVGGDAWRWLGWQATNPATGRRERYPAEAFGPLRTWVPKAEATPVPGRM